MLKILAALLVISAPVLAQEPYSNTELGFTMNVPEGFVYEGDDPLNLNLVQCFVRTPDEEVGWMRLCVEKLPGQLPREKLHTRDVPPNARVIPFTWKGFELQGVHATTEYEGEPVTLYVALVPLRARGIRVRVEAPTPDAAEAKATLVSTLATFEGESNWLTRGDRAEKAGETFGYFGGILLAIGAGMWIAKRRKED